MAILTRYEQMPEFPKAEAGWECGSVPFNFQIGDLVLAKVRLQLYRRNAGPMDCELDAGDIPQPPPSLDGAAGYVVWSQPIAAMLPVLRTCPGAIVYVPRQYRRFSVSLTGDFASYMAQFSGKTRSTMKRKLRKFAEISRGTIDWREYRTPEQIREFINMARELSAKTYQERLFGIGLPATDHFLRNAQALAICDNVRAYLLFLNEKPISYLYCPAHDGVLVYKYLGYDPNYASLSPGTVLQLLALEALFGERRFMKFDFTEGEGQHKEIFSTHSQLCADFYVINRRLEIIALLFAHRATDQTSVMLGKMLDQLHLKSSARRLLRRS